MKSFIEKVLERDNIKIIEDCEFLDIIEKENNCLGILVKKEEIFVIKLKFIVLVIGGLGGIYKNIINFFYIKGDGVVVVIRYNIKLKDILYI